MMRGENSIISHGAAGKLNAPETSAELLVCPTCHGSLTSSANSLHCARCQADFPIREGIPVFAERDEYWCNVDRSVMRQLIDDAEESGDWQSAMNQAIPGYARHISPLYRADAQFLLPIDSTSRVLDAGSMWGGIAIPLAQYCGEVYALDKTWETLRFLDVRARQGGLSNIRVLNSPIHRLPFPDNTFDCVIVNGVLEWLGTEQDIILERHWSGGQEELRYYSSDPREMQIAGLRELARVLKAGGTIYIAIENRIGLQYFLGHPDDHVNVRFASLLPRRLANLFTKLRRNTPYRTYTYTPNALARLAESAGFRAAKLFSVFPHYNTIARLSPFSAFAAMGRLVRQGDVPLRMSARVKVFLLSQAWQFVPEPVAKHLAPSLALQATKESTELRPPRIMKILDVAGLIDDPADYEAILVNNRFGDGNPVNFVIYDRAQRTPAFFCKVARRRDDSSLQEETDWLRKAAQYLSGTSGDGTIPEVLCSKSVDGVPIQVTRYVEGRRAGAATANLLRRLNRATSGRYPLGLTLPANLVQHWGRRKWLRSIDPVMRSAIAWLATLQKRSACGVVNLAEDGNAWLLRQRELWSVNGIDSSGLDEKLHNFAAALKGIPEAAIPRCMQHGDFDVCNLYMTSRGLVVMDFEHATADGLATFDIANLLFSPLILEWKHDSQERSLRSYAMATGWNDYLCHWIRLYAKASRMSIAVLERLPAIGAIEQNAKTYPAHRDPYDYPMFGRTALEQLLDWRLEL